MTTPAQNGKGPRPRPYRGGSFRDGHERIFGKRVEWWVARDAGRIDRERNTEKTFDSAAEQDKVTASETDAVQ